MKKYVLIEWPDSQKYMEKDWFNEEAYLGPNASYFIPVERIGENSDTKNKVVEAYQRENQRACNILEQVINKLKQIKQDELNDKPGTFDQDELIDKIKQAIEHLD